MSTSAHSWKGLPIGAKAFIGLIIAAGMASLLQAAIHQSSKNIAEFICYLGIAILASRLRVTLLPARRRTLELGYPANRFSNNDLWTPPETSVMPGIA